MKVLITGIAGFIGMHVANRLMEENKKVIGIDNLNNYYSVSLKKSRLGFLTKKFKNFKFKKIDLTNKKELRTLFEKENFDCVVNLAAQAGVRYSIEHPEPYIDSNINGFLNVLECCRHNAVKHLVYASSSSVYGINANMPFNENHHTDHPLSLYGATKKANELMAHSYSNLYSIPCTGLRFFTVYGPWGRPDMALFIFTKSILSNKSIKIFNNGEMARDFTYIDDVVDAIVGVLKKPAEGSTEFNKLKPLPSISSVPHKIFNVGNNNPSSLIEYISELEHVLGKKAIKKFLPMQKGDVQKTFSDTKKLKDWIGFVPQISIKVGIKKFVNWYNEYYQP